MLKRFDTACVGRHRGLVLFAMMVGILSLFVCFLFYVQWRSLPPEYDDGNIYEDHGYGDWVGAPTVTDWDYVVSGTLSQGALYGTYVSSDQVSCWPGVPLDSNGSGLEHGMDALVYQPSGDYLSDSTDTVVVVLPDWFSTEGFGYLLRLLCGNGLLLCGIGIFSVFLKKRLDASDVVSSEKSVARSRGFFWSGFLCFGIGLLLMVCPRFGIGYRAWDDRAVDFLLGTFQAGLVLFVLGIVLLVASRKRACRIAAGIGCFLCGLINFIVLFLALKSISTSVDWNSMLSGLVTARVVYSLILVLAILGFVGVVATGCFLLFRRFEPQT